MSISYAPGAAFALVRPGVVVLLDDAVAPASVSAIWSALEGLGRPDGMADVLDTLTTVLDPSLRELPDFGVVVHESGPEGTESGVLHVVARGRVSVHLAGEAGSETIEAFGMTTWADKRFTDVDRYELAVGETGLPADLALALTTGVVTARSVSWVRPLVPAGAPGLDGATSGTATDATPGTADATIDDDGLAAVVAEAHGAGTAAPAGQDDEAGHADAAAPGGAEDPVQDPAMVPVHPAEPDFARTLGEFPGDEAAVPEDAPVEADADEEPDGQPRPTAADDDDAADNTADAGGDPEPLGLDLSKVERPARPEAPVGGASAERDAAESPQAAETAGDGATGAASRSDDDLEDTVFSLEGVRGVLAARAAAVGDDAAAPSDDDGGAGLPAPAPVVAPAAAHGSLPPVPPPPPEPAASWPQPAAEQQPGAGSGPGASQANGPSQAPYPVYQAAPQMPPGEALPAASSPVPAPAPDQGGWAAPGPTSAPYPQGTAGLPQAHAPQVPAGGPSAPAGTGAQWTVQLPGTPGPADEVAPAPVPSQAPTILARSCAYGHANTPIRSTCSVCGGGLNPQAEVVPRPSLGRAVLSTGDVVELEQPVVLGRYPQAHVVTAQAQAPRLVTVPSPSQDISRSHLEIRLEGWNVLLVDLTTVNGTTLLRPGQPPRRLHPQEPTLVMDGDVADLGDGVRLTFEGLA